MLTVATSSENLANLLSSGLWRNKHNGQSGCTVRARPAAQHSWSRNPANMCPTTSRWSEHVGFLNESIGRTLCPNHELASLGRHTMVSRPPVAKIPKRSRSPGGSGIPKSVMR